MRVCLISFEDYAGQQQWQKTLDSKGVKYDYVNISEPDWLNKALSFNYSFFIVRPNGTLSSQKQLFDERIYILNKVLNKPIYPSYEELLIYENKRMFSYWAEVNDIPHPQTFIYYSIDEAIEAINNYEWPKVAKSNIGAAGSGVIILKSKRQAENLIKKVFHGSGFPRRAGPNLEQSGSFIRIAKKIFNLTLLKNKLKKYQQISKDVQNDNILIQEFVSHEFEWRVVRIGNSFFAHKKIISGDKTSGSKLKGYGAPPTDLLDFVKKVTDKRGFYSQAVDVFENSDGGYLVNEMQTYFGQSDPYQMLIDGKPGRYREIDGKWVFEEGDFASNECYDLRLQHAMQLFSENKLK